MNVQMSDLSKIPAGFGDETQSSQSIFRAALNALSYPGKLTELKHDANPPVDADPITSVLLLALLDSESSLWLSHSLKNTLVSSWLQFHTDCTVTENIEKADFVWIKNLDELPQLIQLQTGTDQYPDRSATCIIEIESLTQKSENGAFLLQGPGIKDKSDLEIKGWSKQECVRWNEFWNSNNDLFPCGVDVFLSDGKALVGLPRTTALSFLQREV